MNNQISYFFTTQEQGKQLLASPDQYTKEWSVFDIQSRLNDKKGSEDMLFLFIKDQVLPWGKHQQQNVTSALEDIERRLAQLQIELPFVDSIPFVLTTGLEEGSAAAYTREKYIVLSERTVNGDFGQLKSTILHELFHVCSRNDVLFREKMYACIDFKMIQPIPKPDHLKKFGITNPDAPFLNAYATFNVDGKDRPLVMVLHSSKTYDQGSFFDYLEIGFCEIDVEKREVKLEREDLKIYTLNDIPGFYEKVGKNTTYLLHPEEIMAENFVLAILGEKEIKTPKITDAILANLKRKH